MNVSNSPLATYYAGNTALKVDPHAAKRSQEVIQAIRQAKEVISKPHAVTEQVIEGELLNKKRGTGQGVADNLSGREFFAQRQFSQQVQSQAQTYRANQAIAEYQSTAQVNNSNSKYLDLYV